MPSNGSDDPADDTNLVPSWVSQLEPELAAKLEALETDDLYELEAYIEWYEGTPPAHIVVRGLEHAVPGYGPQLIKEGLERSKLERSIVERNSKIGAIQATISQATAALFGLISIISSVFIVLTNDDLSTAEASVLIVMMIVGVGGPLAAALLAKSFKFPLSDVNEKE